MKRLLFYSLIFFSVKIFAQTDLKKFHNDESHPNFLTQAKTTNTDTAENFYDINYLSFDLNMSNTSTALSGNVITVAKVVAPSMNKYVFELDAAYTIDSIKFNNQNVTATTNGFTRTVNLSSALLQNALFTVTVGYHGQTTAGTSFFTRGLVHANVAGGEMIYSLSDMYLAKDWWPCKQALTDKIDSVDMKVTVPDGLKVGSNGLLKQVVSTPGFSRYEWKTKYPIEYYLISVAIAPYKDYSYYMHFSNSTDSMLVQNYIYDSTNFMQQYKNNIDTIGLVIDYFSQLFGRYPYWKEKHGHCMSNLSGGMEHQTMITVGIYSTVILAHELCHQWWGDNATYKTWRDIWLSEGWASYGEQLFLEHFQGSQAAFNYRQTVFNNAMSSTGGTLYVDDTDNAYRVFDSRLTYDKGAAVAHMLRYVAPNDSVYFSALKAYQQQYAYGLATTEDFKNVLQQHYGYSLDTFFNQWVYGEGYPTYTVKWNQTGNQTILLVQQTVSKPTITPLFYTPLEIKLQSAQGDTTIRFYNNSDAQLVTINWSHTLTGVVVDPNNGILNRIGLHQHDGTLSVQDNIAAQVMVHPNPSNGSWTIEHLEKGCDLSLFDLSGRKLFSLSAGESTTVIPCQNLQPGIYILKTIQSGGTKTIRLVKW